MSQADELESLCRAIRTRAEIACDGMDRPLCRLEVITENGGFLDERTTESIALRAAALEFRRLANTIDNLTQKLVANAKVRA